MDNNLADCLLKFMQYMEGKLITREISGWKGWDDRNQIPDAELMVRLKKNLEERDYVDVANLSMFLWYRNRLFTLPVSR